LYIRRLKGLYKYLYNHALFKKIKRYILKPMFERVIFIWLLIPMVNPSLTFKYRHMETALIIET